MSSPVTVQSLATVLTRYRFVYLVTTSATGAPHAAPVTAVLHGGDLVVNGLGRRTRQNALARPAVGLLWPPQSAADYSLIVDGQAVVTGDSLRITPTRAVLHRPAPSPEPHVSGVCGADCVELALSI
jgi:hypothetical protein